MLLATAPTVWVGFFGRYSPAYVACCCAIAGLYFTSAIKDLVINSGRVSSYDIILVMCGSILVWSAYRVWKRRPPRKRKPRGALSRITRRGGRLIVVPVTGGR